MESNLFSRRSALAALGLAVLAPGCASTSNGPALYRKFRAVQIDVKPLAAFDPFSASIIAQATPQWIPRYFGPYLAPGDASAPVLVLRYEQLSFGLPGSANGPYGTGAMDSVTGVGVVMGPGGHVLSTYPLTCSLFTNVDENDASGAYSRNRIASLGQALAQFMPGKLGL
jgi:hypothetical protein